MGYSGDVARMPLTTTGLRDDRNVELLPPTSLLPPSKNMNYHQNGLSMRGGTNIVIAGKGNAGQGGIDFRTFNSHIPVFAAGGVVYQTNYSNPIKSGLSLSNPISFVQTSKYLLFADGQSNPQYWDGNAPASVNIPPAASWTGNMPFQMVKHTRAGSGAGDRAWAITRDGAWYSKLNSSPPDFSSGDAGFIPVDSFGGLIGGYDLGGQLFVFSRTQSFFILDTDPTLTNWGYQNAIWEGGAATFRLICQAQNNLFIMAEDGLIYNIMAVIQTGSYASSPLNRPAFIDTFIRNNVNLGNIQNFHAIYDRTLRAIKFFMQEGGSGNNIALTYFVDKDPATAWIIHDNESFPSAYNATCSFEVRTAPGNYQIWTMDSAGNVWNTEQPNRDDNGNAYPVYITTKRQDINQPRNNKHWMGLILRGAASGQVNFTMHLWVEGVRQADQSFTINGSGASFDSAQFDSATFATESLTTDPIILGFYGRDLQIQLVQNTKGQDFFLSEILYLHKMLGVKIAT